MGDSKAAHGSVVIIGAGTQGRRLAYMWSSRGGTVYLIDHSKQQLEAALVYVHQLRAKSADESGNWGDIFLSGPTQLAYVLRDAWLAVECVPEKLSLKQEVISQLDSLAPDHAIIASNSSSYGIGEIIQGIQLRNDQRLLSAHCYWPPETSAIEIMGHEGTDPSCVAVLLDRCREHGFSPFHVKRNSIGIWAAIKRETLLVLSEGVCGPQEIDAIFKDVLQTPKGPCEQMDVVGLDVVLDIENHYAESRSGLPSEPRELLKEMIRKGLLGVKGQRGFYDYGDAPEQVVRL